MLRKEAEYLDGKAAEEAIDDMSQYYSYEDTPEDPIDPQDYEALEGDLVASRKLAHDLEVKNHQLATQNLELQNENGTGMSVYGLNFYILKIHFSVMNILEADLNSIITTAVKDSIDKMTTAVVTSLHLELKSVVSG